MSDVARRLHNLISALNDAKGAHPFARWEEVLDAKQASPEFVERHTAAVSLFSGTVSSIRALPASSTRERRLSYTDGWWRAIVLPDRAWGEQGNRPFLDQASLDMLDATAEHLEGLGGPSSVQDVDSALASLRGSVAEWIALVGDDQSIPRSLRMVLLERLESLVWFIDHAEQFGISSVVRSGETASGALLRAAVAYQRRSWLQRLAGLVGAITLVATGLGEASATIDYAQEIYREIEAGVTGQVDPDDTKGTSGGEAKEAR